MKGSISFFILLFFLGAIHPIEAEPIRVSQNDTIVSLGGKVSYWEDMSGKTDIKDIPAIAASFIRPSEQKEPSFGFKQYPMWFGFDIEYTGEKPDTFLIVLDYALVDDVRLYVQNMDKTWIRDDNSLYKNAYRPVFPVQLYPGTNRFFLRIKTQGTLRLPLYLYKEDSYRIKTSVNIAYEGIFFGALLLAAFINLFFFYVYKREPDGIASLFLSLFIVFYIVFQSIQYGFVLLFFPKNILSLFQIYVLSGVLGLVALSLFMIFFYKEDQTHFHTYKIFIPFWLTALIFIFLTFLTEAYFYVRIFALTGFLFFIPNLWLVFRFKGKTIFLGRELLYSYILFIISIIVFGLRGLGFIPSNIFTLNSIPLGFLAFIVLLTLIQFKRFQILLEERNAMEKDWKELYEASTKFVPQEFLSFMQKSSIKDIRLGDQTETDLTLMFSDIRHFTSIVERLTPSESFEFLNNYFNCIGPIIRKHNGFIDKYIGDGIMAIFPNSADDALKAALEIQQALGSLNIKYKAKNWPLVYTGIGIHSGSCMVGTIGEAMRMDTTVISDVVNIASRLESLTKIFGTTILISEQVVMSLVNPAEINLRFLGKVMVKGKSVAVSVFQVLNEREYLFGRRLRFVYDDFEKGMFAFFQRDFTSAIDLFKKVLKTVPSDIPAKV